MPDEKTPEELEAEAIARGDFVEGADDDEPEAEAEDDSAPVEEDDEPEGEEEEPFAEEEEEDEPGDDPDVEEEEEKTIPKFRYDTAQRKAREREEALQNKIHQMESQLQTTAEKETATSLEDELDTLNTEYEDLLLQGEVDKARDARRKRDTKQTELLEMRLQQTSQQTSIAAINQMRFDAQLAQFEAAIPSINPDSKDFDQTLANEVFEVLQAFEASGKSSSAALNKAIHYVIGEESSAPTGKDPGIVRSKRGQQARKRVAKAAQKSPPDLRGKGRDSGKTGDDGMPDVSKMTPEQFDKLSDAELKRLRADTLTGEEAA